METTFTRRCGCCLCVILEALHKVCPSLVPITDDMTCLRATITHSIVNGAHWTPPSPFTIDGAAYRAPRESTPGKRCSTLVGHRNQMSFGPVTSIPSPADHSTSGLIFPIDVTLPSGTITVQYTTATQVLSYSFLLDNNIAPTNAKLQCSPFEFSFDMYVESFDTSTGNQYPPGRWTAHCVIEQVNPCTEYPYFCLKDAATGENYCRQSALGYPPSNSVSGPYNTASECQKSCYALPPVTGPSPPPPTPAELRRVTIPCIHIGDNIEDPATCGCGTAVLRKCGIHGQCRKTGYPKAGESICLTCPSYQSP